MSIPKKCRVSVLEAPRKMVLKTVDVPKIGADAILVKVEGCGICGTDVHEYKGDPFKFCPIQLGHEGTGEIVAIGANVKTDFAGKPLKVGDKIVTGLKSCGVCDTCRFHPEVAELCNGGEIFGLLPGPKHYLNGWFGEYMKVNKGGVVFNVSDMDRDLRILIEPAAVIVHAVEQAKQIFNFKFNSYVLVHGIAQGGVRGVEVHPPRRQLLRTRVLHQQRRHDLQSAPRHVQQAGEGVRQLDVPGEGLGAGVRLPQGDEGAEAPDHEAHHPQVSA